MNEEAGKKGHYTSRKGDQNLRGKFQMLHQTFIREQVGQDPEQKLKVLRLWNRRHKSVNTREKKLRIETFSSNRQKVQTVTEHIRSMNVQQVYQLALKRFPVSSTHFCLCFLP